MRILSVEVGNEDLTVRRPPWLFCDILVSGGGLQPVSKNFRGDSTMVLSTLEQKQERSSRRLGQSLANTETHKRRS